MTAIATLNEVPIAPRDLDAFRTVLDEAAHERLMRIAAAARARLDGRTVWCLNSTARGGGVAEMLAPLLAYTRGSGIDTRWLVVEGTPPFFELTKRIHHRLHGSAGDGGPLGPEERDLYEATLARNAVAIEPLVRPGDVVLLHDPQTAGLAPALRARGATVVWRCHVGADEPNDLMREAWRFLLDDVRAAHGLVFSRRAFVWEGVEATPVWIIPPSIDVFSPKNHELEPGATEAILRTTGLLQGHPAPAEARFVRSDGAPGNVLLRAEILEEAPVPMDARLVAQVSRWDPLKDPMGVMRGFARHVADPLAHLVLAGPSTAAVADDPEAAAVLAGMHEAWRALPDGPRRRVHLASLPMDDLDENAAIVNALQRRADVVVQKSLAEGFGLTVTEGMWKGAAMIASAVGGIHDQIDDGVHGLLLDDPRDLTAFGGLLNRLLADPALRDRLGHAAQARVREEFLESRHLAQWADVVDTLV